MGIPKLNLHDDYNDISDMLKESKRDKQGYTLISTQDRRENVDVKASMSGGIQHATYAVSGSIELFVAICKDLREQNPTEADWLIMASVQAIMDDLKSISDLLK